MKNNIKKIFGFITLLTSASLLLGGCVTEKYASDKDKNPSGEDVKPDPSSEGNTPDPSGEDTPKTSFPASALQAFLTEQGLDTTVPSPVSEGEWTYEVKNDYGTYFEASVADSGVVGTNSIEDTYKALLENTVGWRVDDSQYDAYGYLANDGVVEIEFYTEDGKFNFWASEFVGQSTDLIESDVFPVTELQAFLTEQKLTTAVPTPVSQEKWLYEIYEDESLGACFYANTVDNGTIGKDSIEDTFTALLVSQDWEIDDSQYDDDGLHATKGDVGIIYFTFTGSFDIYIYAYDGSGTPITPDNPDTPSEDGWFLVNNVNDLADGDVIVIAENSEEVVLSGDITGGSSAKYFEPKDASFSDDEITDLPDSAVQFTLGKSGNNWTLTSDDQELGATAVKKLSWDQGTTTWDISIADGKATIENTNSSYGHIFYNSATPRFTTYTSSPTKSMLLPQIYKLNGEGGSCTPVTPTEPEPKEKADWTVMIYMCGSDLESVYGAASDDIKEILNVKNQPDDVNIIIETGGSSEWQKYNIPSDKLARYHVENQQLVPDFYLKEASMGEESTFESFLSWGLEYYPADHVGVIMWNHGGALSGVCSDEVFGDELLNSETKTAFEKVLDEDNKLEFIGYDACLMQVQDIAEVNSHYFNYMIGSEESESGTGWDYDNWVDNLYNKQPIETILKEICDTFIAENDEIYEEDYGGAEYNDQTLSYLDLSKMADYKAAFESLAGSLTSIINKKEFTDFMVGNIYCYADLWVDDDEYESMLENGYAAYMFDPETDEEKDPKTGEMVVWHYFYGCYDYASFDVKDFLLQLKDNTTLGIDSATKTKIENTITALEALIAYNKAGAVAAEGSYGLAFICPVDEYTVKNAYPASETAFTTWRNAVTGEREFE